ncbi:MAG: hypothetical protein AAFV53_30245 [Myxococcota bacterium]
MTPSDIMLFSAIGGLVLNHVILRLPSWDQRMWLFWMLQILNIAAASLLLVKGIPDFRETLPIANWMLGLLFIFHGVTNNQRLQKAWMEQRAARRSTDSDRHAAIRAALRAGDDADG